MRLIDADALIKSMKSHTVEDNRLTDDYKAGLTDSIRTAVALAENASTIDAVPVVRGEWTCTIKKGSCMDYHVTAKCSECGWDWFSKEGVGNYSAVFSAFITNGDSRPEEAKRFLLENARANNNLNYCPACGAKIEDKPCG